MRSRVWQGSSVVVLSWLLLACSSSKTAAPVQGLGNDGLVSTIPARQMAAQPAIQGNSYTVKKGDTLYSIAFNSGNDVPSLANLNGISPPTTSIRVNRSGSMPPAAPWPLRAVQVPIRSVQGIR